MAMTGHMVDDHRAQGRCLVPGQAAWAEAAGSLGFQFQGSSVSSWLALVSPLTMRSRTSRRYARRGFFEVFESTKSPIAAEVKDEGLKVDDFIVKPLELDVLKAKLDRLSGYVASWSETSRNAETGAFLSIQLDATEDVSTLRLFGILHQDDKLALKDIPDRVAMTPRDDVSAG